MKTHPPKARVWFQLHRNTFIEWEGRSAQRAREEFERGVDEDPSSHWALYQLIHYHPKRAKLKRHAVAVQHLTP